MSKKTKLIPPDKKQCQAQRQEGCHPDAQHFMIIGPGRLVRCTNKPTVIVYENEPGDDGLKGSMSLCNDCWDRMIKQLGPDFATAKPITT